MKQVLYDFNETDPKKKPQDTPPGAPDRTPVKDPSTKDEKPMGDPQPPEKKKPRLKKFN